MVWILPDEEEKRIEQITQNRMTCMEAINKQEQETEELKKYMPVTHVGFYAPADELNRLVFRASLVAAMRAKVEGFVGVMITASSRKNDINGIKLLDKDGKAWTGHWMFVLELIVNTVDIESSLRNMNEVSIRGFPTSADIFGNEAIEAPL